MTYVNYLDARYDYTYCQIRSRHQEQVLGPALSIGDSAPPGFEHKVKYTLAAVCKLKEMSKELGPYLCAFVPLRLGG